MLLASCCMLLFYLLLLTFLLILHVLLLVVIHDVSYCRCCCCCHPCCLWYTCCSRPPCISFWLPYFCKRSCLFFWRPCFVGGPVVAFFPAVASSMLLLTFFRSYRRDSASKQKLFYFVEITSPIRDQAKWNYMIQSEDCGTEGWAVLQAGDNVSYIAHYWPLTKITVCRVWNRIMLTP